MANILISIDHKWRDVPGNVYAALLLERLGHKVTFVRNGLEKYFLSEVKPNLVILIHVHEKSRQKFVQELSSMGILVVLMPTEGMPTLEKYRRFDAGILADFTGVDIHFAWNEVMARIVRENETIDDKKVLVTGVPRFDFYTNPLSSTLMSKKKFCDLYEFNNELPIITFATNFTQAIFHTQKQDFLLNDADNLGYKDIMEELHGGPIEVARRDYESREILIDAFVKLVKAKPDVNFILKAHPSEDHQYYHDVFSKLLDSDISRVAIITTAYIWDVLNVTDILLKRSCTTGIEAWMLGKPTIEMKINPDEWYFSEEHASGSNVISTYNEMEKLVNDYLSGKSVSDDLLKARKNFITTWCFKHDGKSTQRMVSYINDMLQGNLKNVIIPRSSIKTKLIRLLLGIGDYLVHDLRVYGLNNILKKIYVDELGREDKYMHKKDIENWRVKLKDIVKENG